MTTNDQKIGEALARQCENMAFVLNRASLPDQWYSKFMRELESDKAALLQSPSQPVEESLAAKQAREVMNPGFGSVAATGGGQSYGMDQASLQKTQITPDECGSCPTPSACGFHEQCLAHPQASPPPVQSEVTRDGLCRLIEAHCPERGDHGHPIGSQVEALAGAILAHSQPDTQDHVADAGKMVAALTSELATVKQRLESAEGLLNRMAVAACALNVATDGQAAFEAERRSVLHFAQQVSIFLQEQEKQNG